MASSRACSKYLSDFEPRFLNPEPHIGFALQSMVPEKTGGDANVVGS